MKQLHALKLTKNTLGMDRFFRTAEYTTNGYWMIKTSLEPTFMSELANEVREINTEHIVAGALNDLETLEIRSLDLKEKKYLSQAVILSPHDSTEITVINAHFFKLLYDAGNRKTVFKQGKKEEYQYNNYLPVYCYNGDTNELIGVVMPIKLQN